MTAGPKEMMQKALTDSGFTTSEAESLLSQWNGLLRPKIKELFEEVARVAFILVKQGHKDLTSDTLAKPLNQVLEKSIQIYDNYKEQYRRRPIRSRSRGPRSHPYTAERGRSAVNGTGGQTTRASNYGRQQTAVVSTAAPPYPTEASWTYGGTPYPGPTGAYPGPTGAYPGMGAARPVGPPPPAVPAPPPPPAGAFSVGYPYGGPPPVGQLPYPYIPTYRAPRR